MSHFAEIDETGNVLRVIVADQAFIDSGAVGDPAKWVQTSYNTRGGQHLTGGEPVRKNFAGVGYVYDKQRDAFIPPKPHASWTLDEQKATWRAPVEPTQQQINENAEWDESSRQWRDSAFKSRT